MARISKKTLTDLQFDTVLDTVAGHCVTDMGREKAFQVVPIEDQIILMEELTRTAEYQSSLESNTPIPNHGFDQADAELKMLAIDGSFLEAAALRRLATIELTTGMLIAHLKKFNDYYPALDRLASEVPVTKEVSVAVDAVIDKYGEVRDDASAELTTIRKSMGSVRAQINQSFTQALSYNNAQGYLDDIRESIVDGRRVLAVLAMHRRKVKGSVLGTSKTGSIAFIEPESTHRFTRELSHLEFEEKEEITRILKAVSAKLRPLVPNLHQYQDFLSTIDLTAAKAKYAVRINGILPKINNERRLALIQAYHPILYLTNLRSKQPTFPQTIELDQNNRIIVISGPNAGGKTISLKTVGLLQLMLQSGLLIPVHPRSETFLFDRIMTDIGDNQSIENHLSTYSYRLKNMNQFLRKCNRNTLFLIDEFGTGSDPELGGALAEVFLEEFYHREAFGLITTHYANLKMLANELEHATNANMLFDEKSLEPMYKLILGEAGSSFTFEVAQKNGIPYGLINRARKKIESGKVRFDKTIASLQKERSKLEKTSASLKEEETKAREESQKLEAVNQKIRQKLESYQELYDSNQKAIYLGQKIEEMALKYFNNKDKKSMIGEFLKMVEIENSKRKKESAATKKAVETKKKEVLEEVKVVVEEIRKEKKEKKKKEASAPKPRPALKIGDRVRMIDGKSVGTIDDIEKNKALVNYGIFTSKVSLDALELVEAAKK
jgi:DNA mismatch repair protein MutS2